MNDNIHNSTEMQRHNEVNLIKTISLMLCIEINAVCSDVHTKYISALCGQNAEFIC